MVLRVVSVEIHGDFQDVAGLADAAEEILVLRRVLNSVLEKGILVIGVDV